MNYIPMNADAGAKSSARKAKPASAKKSKCS